MCVRVCVCVECVRVRVYVSVPVSTRSHLHILVNDYSQFSIIQQINCKNSQNDLNARLAAVRYISLSLSRSLLLFLSPSGTVYLTHTLYLCLSAQCHAK